MTSQLLIHEIQQEQDDERRRVIGSHDGHEAVKRSWLDPREHDEIVGIDFGSGTASLYFLREQRDQRTTIEQLPSLLMSLRSGTAVVVELAHMGRAQTSQSKAQPYTADTLLSIYERLERNGVTLRLVPHQHSRAMREWSARHFARLVDAEKSSDANDARAIACYVEHKNAISLMKPPRSFERSRNSLYGDAVRAESNVVLNDASCRGYEGQVHRTIAVLADDAVARLARPGGFMTKKVAFSLASLVASERDGKPVRFVLDGRQMGWRRFKEHVCKFSPCHQRGGRARSNIFWHTFRPFLERFAIGFGESVKSGARYVRHANYTEEQEAIKKAAHNVVRGEMAAAYRLLVEMTAGLESLEILEERSGGQANAL